ncbi:tRNA-specific adenosine deaminase 3 [Cryptococcus neoformans]|nr:tRNA-specific adenosine deaminase 3 [Cryptococcus neoformans var. grubii Bt1]OXG31059.1 tRNA-specific adenosine deaminase 3 [Cryptococcus neoformans var. grubii Ze90-1]OXH38841.1 tRNA-specific adenosine deaminase 3 [Cryptococcus neoformans var. grubii]
MHKNETTNHPPPEATSSTIHQPLSPDSLQDNSDTHPLNPFGLFIRPHPTRGNGLFSPRLIPAGTVIEESPVLVLTKEQWEQGQMNGTILGEYGFCWSAGGMAIGLGLASLFNHSSRPNVNFIRSPSTKTIRFVTAKSISPGEELCICYTADESKLWFTPARGEEEDNEVVEGESDEGDGLPGDVDGLVKDVQQANLNSSEPTLQAPRPVHVSSLPSYPSSSSSSPASQHTIPPSSLPAPLHSSGHKASGQRHLSKHRQPATLVDDLAWQEDEWKDEKGRDRVGEGKKAGEDWGEVIRVKGPAERENDGNDRELMQVWILEFSDAKLTKTALNFSKEIWPNDVNERLRHLKRVCRRNEDGKEICRIALCPLDEHSADSLSSLMTAFSPLLSSLTPKSWSVPSSGARTQEQLKWKHHIWPVSFSPAPIIPVDSSSWPISRKAWVAAGIKRVLKLAVDAKQNSELPVATFCTSAPPCFWPTMDGFIPPTLNLRASSCDTRISESHPLRHATLNCVASIAHLRTVPPFTDVPPTRNGADYLLTSLSLFISHEPCVMCAMALLHSRVREVFYVFPRKKGGGFEYNEGNEHGEASPVHGHDEGAGTRKNIGEQGGFGIHARRDLNHRFEVWKWDGHVDENVRKELEIDENLQL